jgi:hypothetical protein
MRWFAAQRLIFRKRKQQSLQTGSRLTSSTLARRRRKDRLSSALKARIAQPAYTHLMGANQKLTRVIAGGGIKCGSPGRRRLTSRLR